MVVVGGGHGAGRDGGLGGGARVGRVAACLRVRGAGDGTGGDSRAGGGGWGH